MDLIVCAVAAQLGLVAFYVWRLVRKPPPSRTGPPEWARHGNLLVSEKVALDGPEWSPLTPYPALYNCPCCGSVEEVELQQYFHIPTKSVVGVLRHRCPDQPASAEPITDAIPEWTVGGVA